MFKDCLTKVAQEAMSVKPRCTSIELQVASNLSSLSCITKALRNPHLLQDVTLHLC